VSGFTKGTKNAGTPVMPRNILFHYMQPHLDKYATFQRHPLMLLITEHIDTLTTNKSRIKEINNNNIHKCHIKHSHQLSL